MPMLFNMVHTILSSIYFSRSLVQEISIYVLFCLKKLSSYDVIIPNNGSSSMTSKVAYRHDKSRNTNKEMEVNLSHWEEERGVLCFTVNGQKQFF